MKLTATVLIVAAVLGSLVAADRIGELPAHQLRGTRDDSLDASIVPDAILGSTRSKSRLVAVSTADDDAAVMTTHAKTMSLFGGGDVVPTHGASAVRSDATGDKAAMTATSATAVRTEGPDN